jgi:hypothetical protein
MSDYQTKVYRKPGGDELVVADGGLITIEAGGEVVNDGDVFVSADFDTEYFTVANGEVSMATSASNDELDSIAGAPVTFTVALAASATTDGMDITITAKDAAGDTVAATIPVEWWISESAAGAGLTADSYSGTVTASVGAINTALTAKKHFLGVTHTSGILVATAVASANPADQYVCVRKPRGDGVVVSAASGTSWEGA